MSVRRRLAFLCPAAGLLAGALAAQPRPISGVFQISRPFASPAGLVRSFGEPAVGALGNGGFAVGWTHEDSLGAADLQGSGVDGRLVSAAGIPGGDFRAEQDSDPSTGTGCPVLAGVGGSAGGGFLLAHLRLQEPNSVVETWSYGAGAAAAARIEDNVGDAAESDDDECPALAASAAGRHVVGWARTHPGDSPTTYFVRSFAADGAPAGPPLALDSALADGGIEPPAVAMDGAGRFVAAWRGGASPGLFARRFAADGTPLGAGFQVAPAAVGGPLLALAADGGFTVVYARPVPGGGALTLRRFAADGTAQGGPVAAGTVSRLLQVAADRFGNFAVLSLGASLRTRVQIFDRSLAAHGGPVVVAPAPPASTVERRSAIALADSGRLLVAWIDGPVLALPSQPSVVRGQLWQALHETNRCADRGNHLHCDSEATGRLTAGDEPLLGDPGPR